MGRIRRDLLAAALALACAGCVTVGTVPVAPPSATEREYEGIGQDPSLLGAMDRAKMDAVRNAVVDLIGTAGERANHALLSRGLYETRESEAYVVDGSFVTVREERIDEGYLVEARVIVRVEAVADAIRSLLDPSGGPAGGPASAGPVAAAGVAPDEERSIRDRVESLTWLVSFVDRGGATAPALRAAAVDATEYLVGRAMKTVEPSRLEALVIDGRKAWTAETGGSVGIAPWAARKLNADVYLEIDGDVAVSRSGNRWSASASVELRIYEVLTARLLATVPWTSAPGEWHPSEAAAASGALRASVARIMPLAVNLAKARLAAELRGTIASMGR